MTLRRKALLLTLAAVVLASSTIAAARNRPIRAVVQAPIVVIFMENKSYAKLEGFPAASHAYLDAFAAGGVRFTHYTEGTSVGPSLPDYLGVAAGSACGKTSDTVKAGDPIIGSACPTTLWNQLTTAGVSWGVYMDNMPSACSASVTFSTSGDGPYALKHNPATPFPSIWGNQTLCKAHVLPYTSLVPTALPQVSFIAPNICNDQHGSKATKWTNCLPNSTALIQRGDDWLKARVPAMLAAGAEVFITYDEQGSSLYAAEDGVGIAPSLVGTTLTHYGLLRALENRFGLACLNSACSATAVPL